KYRPLTFSDVVGQEHITKTLAGQLSSGKIFHAYLFTGTRGTGKTTCAKILAKAVNCQSPVNGDPCGECAACRAVQNGEVMDIVEIDAASNNSVDNIRELREQLQFTPANAKYRVYIIDEVHMLTISAFNALLKTLEEPPAHVIFVLATTEVHKLPATILSRCQRFDFKRIEPKKITERIKMVADKEDFQISDNAAFMIASIADGGMRDALSILDLCVAASKNVTEDVVTEVCGMAGDEYLLRFGDFIADKNSAAALYLINELYNNSVDMLRLLSDLVVHFRNLLIVKTVERAEKPIVCSSEHLAKLEQQANRFTIAEIMRNMRLLQDTTLKMQSGNRRCELELALIKLCSPQLCSDFESLAARISALEKGGVQRVVQPPVAPIISEKSEEIPVRRKSEPEVVPSPVKVEEAPVSEVEEEEIPLPTEENEIADFAESAPVASAEPISEQPAIKNEEPAVGKLETAVWKSVLAELAKTAPLISGILNSSSAYINGQFLLIDTDNTQFAELINGKNNVYREKLRGAIEAVLGQSYKLGPYRKKAQATAEDPLLPFKERLKALEIPKN
ncbi:MAG: DNA polymerase III subunit gamma/tau, partial [Clostridia bacterium]|nr:DNA polymerase III subunit gamma/tau [Clostridia bacterium]